MKPVIGIATGSSSPSVSTGVLSVFGDLPPHEEINANKNPKKKVEIIKVLIKSWF
jgi:hypothetical protein